MAELRPTSNLVVPEALQLDRKALQSGFFYVYRKLYSGPEVLFMTKLWACPMLPSIGNDKRFGSVRKGIKDAQKTMMKQTPAGYLSVKKVMGAEPYFRVSVPLFAFNKNNPGANLTILLHNQLLGSEYEKTPIDPTADQVGDMMDFQTELKAENPQIAASVTVSAERVINSINGLDARSRTVLQQCLLQVRIQSKGGLAVVFADFKITKEEAQQMTSTHWIELRDIDLYPMLLQWVRTGFGAEGLAPFVAFPISKIAHTLPKTHTEQARVNRDSISISPKGRPTYLPRELDQTLLYEDRYSQAGTRADGSYALVDINEGASAMEAGTEVKQKLPPNIPVLIDWVNNKYSYTNTSGFLEVLDLTRYQAADVSHIRCLLQERILTDKILASINALGVPANVHPAAFKVLASDAEGVANLPQAGTEDSIVEWFKFFATSFDKESGHPVTFSEISTGGYPPFRPIARYFKVLKEAVLSNLDAVYARYSVSYVMENLAWLVLMVNYASDFEELKAKDKTNRAAAIRQEVTPGWVPPSIPLLSDKIGMLPHQLKVRNLMKDSPDFALFRVSAGGGKSVLALTDILYEIKANRNQPYLILCPGHLVANYVKEIVFFTSGKLNVISLNTYVIKQNGFARLQAMLEKAPRNTVVVADYDVLKTKQKSMCYGTTPVTVFPVIDFLRQFGFGYCLTGDTRLYTNTGIQTLKEIYEDARIIQGSHIRKPQDVKVRGMGGEYGVAKVARRKSKRLKVTTRFGYQLKGSPEHPVRVLDSKMRMVWRDLSDLQAGDLLCIDKATSFFNAKSPELNIPDFELYFNVKRATLPSHSSPELARLLGYQVAEGNLAANTVEFTNFDEDLLADYKTIGESVFGLEVRHYSKSMRFNSRHMLKIMEYLGVGKNSYKQVVPWPVLKGTREEQVQFLQAYFEGDGGVNGHVITARSVSRKLVQQLQTMLLNFGIVSDVKSSIDWNQKPTYTLNIRQEFRDVFESEIGFLSTRKQELLALKIDATVQDSTHHYIPQLREFIERIHNEYQYATNGYWRLDDGTFARVRPFPGLVAGRNGNHAERFTTIKSTVEAGVLKQISPKEHNILKEILDSGYYFDPVTKIEELEDGYVYNISVPETETFVANGVLTHNCLLDESHKIKNETTARTRAVMSLITDIPKKRLASGTMAHDSPSDLAMQVASMDPTLFGTKEEFNNRYGLEVQGDRVIQWKPGAQAEIRRKIKSRIVDAEAMRKEWAALLPRKTEWIKGVTLTDEQYRVYNEILTGILAQIKEDAKTNKALQKFLNPEAAATPEEGEDAEDELKDEDAGEDMANLLKRYLARLEQFMVAPASDPLGDRELKGDDRISPKALMIIERIKLHIEKGYPGKVLIFTNYVESAEELYRLAGPALQASGILYKAANKDVDGDRFEKDKSIKWMVGVEQSMNEGLNFQFCSRLIRAEQVWNPGTLEQGDSRINRPELKTTEERTEIFYDYILCNSTIDITKMSRLISKVIAVAKFENSENPAYATIPDLPIIKMSFENIETMNSWSENLAEYNDAFAQYKNVRDEEYKDYKDNYKAKFGTDPKLQPLTVAENPPDAKLMSRVPYPPGLDIYGSKEAGLVRLDQYINKPELAGEDIEGAEDVDEEEEGAEDSAAARRDKAIIDSLVGRVVHTEYGDGILHSVGLRVKRVPVDLFSGFTALVRKSAVFVTTRTETSTKDIRNELLKKIGGLPIDTPVDVPADVMKQSSRALKLVEQRKQKQVVKKEKKQQQELVESLSGELQFTVVNGFLGITYFVQGEDDKVSRALQAVGFRPDPLFYYAKMPSAARLKRQLNLWQEKGFRPDPAILKAGAREGFAELYELLKGGKLISHSDTYKMSNATQIKNFYRMEHKPSNDKHLFKPYPLIEDELAYIALPIQGQTATREAIKVKATNVIWRTSKSTLSFFGNTSQINQKIAQVIEAGIDVSNVKDLRKDFTKVKKMSVRSEKTVERDVGEL